MAQTIHTTKKWKNPKNKVFFTFCKGQIISKGNRQAANSSKKQTNEFIFTTMRRVFVHFLEETEDSKMAFRN